MLAGHALATLLCAVLLARGEDALWSLAAWLRPLLRLPAPVAPDAVAVPAVTGWPAECAPLPWRNLRRDSGRGPPPPSLYFPDSFPGRGRDRPPPAGPDHKQRRATPIFVRLPLCCAQA
ncbi:hypothetical protein [Arthrobacter sp. H16F315]|uniref:hypothetical protein n=1 Tax=Arthrobacter sp. H16F315 TaxID=2955314 RepID=UPI003158A794